VDKSQFGRVHIETGFLPEFTDSSLSLRFSKLNLASRGTPRAVLVPRAISQD